MMRNGQKLNEEKRFYLGHVNPVKKLKPFSVKINNVIISLNYT